MGETQESRRAKACATDGSGYDARSRADVLSRSRLTSALSRFGLGIASIRGQPRLVALSHLRLDHARCDLSVRVDHRTRLGSCAVALVPSASDHATDVADEMG